MFQLTMFLESVLTVHVALEPALKKGLQSAVVADVAALLSLKILHDLQSDPTVVSDSVSIEVCTWSRCASPSVHPALCMSFCLVLDAVFTHHCGLPNRFPSSGHALSVCVIGGPNRGDAAA
jgi:hypothetical protein